MRRIKTILFLIGSSILLIACSRADTTSTPSPINLDADTQTLIQKAERVVFIVPFSHWDTDWHEDFPAYAKRSDGNILAAIQLAKKFPRFRYTLEQVLFAQHFWDTHPEARADLKVAVQRRQITFAWAGMTQPETSLVAPAIQIRNLQIGEEWIAKTFGPQYVPRTAWQSDAFGNSAALPLFLAQAKIPYLFIGRSQARCDPNEIDCKPLPHLFHWRSPVADARALVAYVSYPSAWDATHMLDNENAQIAALRNLVNAQFQRTNSKYIFLPMGSDFIDPDAYWYNIVERWNASDQQTVLVMADPATAFEYIAAQTLPEITADLNPIWQAFYVTRPEAKVADKISAYYLTAGDKFGALVGAPMSSAWYTATMNAHYDNIGGVSYDHVWENTQRPRFQQTVATAANDLASTLARVASGVDASITLFNPSAWERSDIVEIIDANSEARELPNTQRIGNNAIAFRTTVPSTGFASPRTTDSPRNPTSVAQNSNRIMLTNNLVSVTLDGARGGAMSSFKFANREFVNGSGDDIVYLDDSGDVYGARFGAERVRSSQVPARLQIIADGPLIARVQVAILLGGQPLTKTITLRADNPRVDVTLDIKALPETTALVQMPTTISTTMRTDDLGFTAFTHPIDARPIISGDVTYRRKIFYPTMYWSDVTDEVGGLALITQGLQGIAGTNTLNFMLVRDVTQDDEGVTDREYHTLRYAYLPHTGNATNAQVWRAAYEFNEPLIPVWRAANRISVQVPFENRVRQFAPIQNAKKYADPFSWLSIESGIVADIFSRADAWNAIVLDYDPATPATLRAGRTITLPNAALQLIPINLTK